MKYLLTIMLLSACSSYHITSEEKTKANWSILELAIKEKWSTGGIVKLLGKPKKIITKQDSESWYYESSENGSQEWSIGFKDKIVNGILFIPTGSMDSRFTLDEILKRWSNLNCKKKKSKWYSKGHTVYQDQYYICNGSKRIDYNRYNEVSWIKVTK